MVTSAHRHWVFKCACTIPRALLVLTPGILTHLLRLVLVLFYIGKETAQSSMVTSWGLKDAWISIPAVWLQRCALLAVPACLYTPGLGVGTQ